ncbi:hypothetical protein [Sphaerisporangium sp. NPDC051011]|uniref:hypothetical protein n=1 Tax=Sphaerisporangium sp. NPDC051011 TaxID=3155792 RepID=UPI0033CAE87C
MALTWEDPRFAPQNRFLQKYLRYGEICANRIQQREIWALNFESHPVTAAAEFAVLLAELGGPTTTDSDRT